MWVCMCIHTHKKTDNAEELMLCIGCKENGHLLGYTYNNPFCHCCELSSFICIRQQH